MMEVSAQVMMMPHTVHHHHQQHQHQLNNQYMSPVGERQQQHSQNIQYINNQSNSDEQQQTLMTNQNQYHHQQQQQQQQQRHHQPHCQQHVQTCNVQQQQLSSNNYSQVFTVAPPTPPSEASDLNACNGSHYLSPQPIEQVTNTNRQPQATTWIMQTPEMGQQQQQQQQHLASNQHEQANRQQQVNNHTSQGNNCNHNTTYHHSQPQHPHQQTTIANYYYDIDDGFSDIMSAPPTPEPAQSMHYQSMPSNHCQQQHHLADQQQHSIKQETYHLDNYLPYDASTTAPTPTGEIYHPHNHHHHHQNDNNSLQHHHHHHHNQQHQNMYKMNDQNCLQHYSSSMSPDSLSTTSSSPSDHSLYQLSPPMSCSIPSSVASGAGVLSPSSTGNQQQFNKQQHLQVAKPIVLVAVDRQQQQQPAQNKGPNGQHHHHRSSPIHLWEFLKELLQQVETASSTTQTTTTTTTTTTTANTITPDASVIRWLDRQKGVFKIEDSVKVAKLWGKRKNKPKMNYDKLSRSIRQYYKKGIMKKTDRSQRLVYQFCSAYCH